MDPFEHASVFALRGFLETLDSHGAPALRALSPLDGCRSIALLPGSFNPPTSAHLLLAERALHEGFDCVLFVLARRTAGKERSSLILEDRLTALRVACEKSFAIAACSHGLYADQAEAAARAFPGAELTFLVGSDKIVQIFEPGWYEDRDAALDRLFDAARVLVAPRWDQGEQLRETLEARANQPWGRRVDVLRLHPAVSDLSSTRVRGLLRAGADPTGLLPPSVANLLIDLRAFGSPVRIGGEDVDVYDVRTRLVDVLWSARGAHATPADLESLTRVALSDDENGRALRNALRNGGANGEDLARARAAARA
jgi:nicotinic acid mononucleotide adenylyltransferase